MTIRETITRLRKFFKQKSFPMRVRQELYLLLNPKSSARAKHRLSKSSFALVRLELAHSPNILLKTVNALAHDPWYVVRAAVLYRWDLSKKLLMRALRDSYSSVRYEASWILLVKYCSRLIDLTPAQLLYIITLLETQDNLQILATISRLKNLRAKSIKLLHSQEKKYDHKN